MADITVRVAAKDFIKSTGTTAVTSAIKGNPLISQGSGHTIEWKVTLPKAGKWRLHALMSSIASCPCNLLINGVQQNSNILGETTNGASSDTQSWFSYGPFDFNAGENVFAIKCSRGQPSLWEFGFSLEQEATAPAPTTSAPAAPAPAPTPDNSFIRVPSKDFTAAIPGAVREDAEFDGLTVCRNTPVAVWYEWKVNLPKAGKWYLHANLAAGSSRPGVMTLNGEKQDQPVCGNTTDGWHANNAKWFVYGPFDCKQGENVFRIDFSSMTPHLKEFAFSPSMLGVAHATVWAADLVAPRDIVTIGDGTFSNLIYTSKAKPSYIEWKVHLPEAGQYTLHALLTAAESRPGSLTLNGVKQTGDILGQNTGSWYSDKLTWVAHGPYEFKQGENVLRVDFANYHAHLRELGFTREKPAEKSLQTGPTKLGPVGSLENANEWQVVPKAGGAQPRITSVTTGHNWSLGSVAAQWDYAGETPAPPVKPQVDNTTGFFEIPAGDHLVAIHVGHGAQAKGYPTNEVVTLQYETLKGLKSPVYGGQSGQPVVTNHSLRAPEGQQIIGFFGANGGNQMVPLRIGVHVEAIPAIKVETPGTLEKRNVGGVVNEYAGVTAIDGNSLTLGGDANPFKPGDRVLVMQMAGASIDIADNDKFGTITNLGGAGHYVWDKVVSVSDKIVKLDAADLRGFDVKGAVQIVRACAHDGDIAVTGHIAAPQWNGTTGGVIVIESAGTIELAEDIDASGRGFVGGAKTVGTGASGFLGYVYAAASGAGTKGAGIGTLGADHVGFGANDAEGDPKPQMFNQGGRGAPANGGGGGNPSNAGGGGGGNGGTGGRGASEYEYVAGGPRVNGGLGGCALVCADRAFMGGGGGAGQDNNNQSSGGGNGGGIIILKAKRISGPPGRFLRANGGAAGAAGGDGAGGGGAGGTIILDAPTISGSFTAQANGGRGGDCAAEHGYGAGGGGGTIRSQQPLPKSITATVLPGDPGSCGRPRGAIVAEKGIIGLLPERPVAMGISDGDWKKLRSALEHRIGTLENRIGALEAEWAKSSACCAKIDALTGDLAALRSKLVERDQTCSVHEQKLADLERHLADLLERHKAAQEALADRERAYIEQDKKLAAQDRKIADYEALLVAFEAKLNKCGDCETKIVEQQKTIADLTDRLANLEAAAVAPPVLPADKPALPPVWPPPSTPARMGISYIHFVGEEKNTHGDEYIEIKNTGGMAQDVTGWRVRAGRASHEFVFPAGTIVAPGGTCRVYTNRAGSFSFKAKRSVWSDAGDVGMLHDAVGTLIDELGYGTKETRTLEKIKATYGVERMKVVYDEAQVAKQKRKNDKIDFLTAVERAIRSLLDDPADQDRLNAANQVRDNFDGVPPNASAEVIQSFIRDTMNKGELKLCSNGVADLELSTKDQWIFELHPGMGDMHWVIVDRMGTKAAHQEMT